MTATKEQCLMYGIMTNFIIVNKAIDPTHYPFAVILIRLPLIGPVPLDLSLAF